MANTSAAWFAKPPSWFFNFPPNHEPLTLAPQTEEPTLATPFSIEPSLYNAALKPQVPMTFAVCYMTFVLWMNRRNRRRQYAPYALSKTRTFYWLTILHNVALAVYSGITCYAMGTGMRRSVKSPLSPGGFPATLDSLCKISGPAGYGRAVTFDPQTSTWSSLDKLVRLAKDGLTPSTGDFGRIWNEGLSFWGWFFYLSKFYEVIDTLIILAKGKRSATLQTYHHAGAMLCMWAGMRFMSPPIWMFVVVNSFIHTLMYTYYTVNGLGFKVPQRLKRTLTTMQITQFVVGAIYATLHLFVSYSVPVSFSYRVSETGYKASSVVSSVAAAVSTSAADGTLVENWMQSVRELVAMVAGSPGIAKRVHEEQHVDSPSGVHLAAGISETVQRGTRYQAIKCLDTSGQAFAVWLNVIYLLPLTVLFVRFFVKAYIFGDTGRTGRSKEKSSSTRGVSESIDAAARETSAAVEGLGRQWERSMEGADAASGHRASSSGRPGNRQGKVVVTETVVVEEELDRAIDELKRQNGGGQDRSKFISPDNLQPIG